MLQLEWSFSYRSHVFYWPSLHRMMLVSSHHEQQNHLSTLLRHGNWINNTSGSFGHTVGVPFILLSSVLNSVAASDSNIRLGHLSPDECDQIITGTLTETINWISIERSTLSAFRIRLVFNRSTAFKGCFMIQQIAFWSLAQGDL